MKLRRKMVLLFLAGVLQLQALAVERPMPASGWSAGSPAFAGALTPDTALAAPPAAGDQAAQRQALQGEDDPEFRLFLPGIKHNSPIHFAREVTSPPVMGVETHAHFGLPDMPGHPGAWVRRNAVLWSEIEPQPGERRWESLADIEDELLYAAQAGAQPILIVRNTPEWAQKIPGSYCGPIEEEDFQAFGRFLYDLVGRYSQPPYSVKHWEIWNEPDVTDRARTPDWQFGCWGDDEDPYFGGGYYAGMLKVIYPLIKAADPEAQVLVGGLMLDCDPLQPGLCEGKTAHRFLEGILKDGGGEFFDGIGFHAYEYYNWKLGEYVNRGWGTFQPVPTIRAKTRYIRSLLNQYGVTGKYLINTETAIVVYSDACDMNCELTKAYYMPQLFSTAMAEGLKGSLWYSVHSGWRHNDLFSLSRQPLPAYQAYLVAWEVLSSALYDRELDLGPGIQGYEFTTRGHKLWVLWSLDGQEHPIQLPGYLISVKDPLGQDAGQNGWVAAASMPLYVEWSSP